MIDDSTAAPADQFPSDGLLAQLVDAFPDAVLVMGAEGRILLANEHSSALFDRPIASLVGAELADLLSARTSDVAAWLRDAQGRPDQPELLAMRRHGGSTVIAVRLGKLSHADRLLSIASIRDTGRVVLAQPRFRELVEAAPDPMIVVDQLGAIVLANRQSEVVFGYGRTELIGGKVEMLLPERYRSVHRAHRGHLLGDTGRKPGDTLRNSVTGLRKDGSEFPIELSLGSIETGDGLLFTTIIRDVTDRRRLDELKSEFVSTVSHELRTPLTSIRGSLGLIAGGAAGVLPAKAKGLIDIAHKSSERLVGLINDILDIEKIQSGQMEMHLDWIEPVALIQQALEANHAYAASYDVSYRLARRPGSPVRVRGDANRLIQVLNNLLSNAAKFSPPGAMVEAMAEVAGGSLRIGVRDHGTGVPPSFQDRIFQRFAQAQEAQAHRGGTGLGLSIAKAIVERHGGQIGFDRPQDGGSLFWFTLPLPGHPTDQAQQPAPSRRVLICEDDPDIATLLKMMIEQAGWQAEIAHDGESALDRAKAGGYHAITVDLRLPGMNGVTLIEALRAFPGTARLPVIIVAAGAGTAQEQLIYGRLEVVDCLSKPIDHSRLLRALRGIGRQDGDRHPRILHVDDDQDVVTVVAAIIGTQASVTPAASLAEARAALANQGFDLVILDLNLPDGCGFDLLTTISTLSPRLPVLIFSAQDGHQPPTAAVSAKLVKSRATNEELRRLVARLLEQPGPE